MVTRRNFLIGTTAGALWASSKLPAADDATGPIIVTNWEHAAGANQAGWPVLEKGETALDAVEAAINYVELMRDGESPGEAARRAMLRIVAKGFHIDGAIVTLNKGGQCGAASLGDWDGGRFEYSVNDRRGPRQTYVESL
ncbi:MAG: hypothetical protein OES47_15460 [Acidobacteriota bacterium]|nr:hypothetical protein [Acidobacteriota bacterium]